MSLVQVPAKLAINLSIHTQHTYDNGVDRTGDRVFRKIQLLHEEREEEKKINPQTMLHLEYSLRTEKKTPQHKSTYTINTGLATGETYPALASSHPVQCHLFRRRSQTCSTGGGKKRYRGSWMGEGSNVCSRGREEGRKRVPLHRSLRVVIQTALAKAPVRGARKDKIKLL